MLQLTRRTLDLTDLHRGDVLLLEPGSTPKTISELVTRLDGSPYSHALLLDSVAPDFLTLSANYAHDGLADGVNAVGLADFVGDEAGENLREARVLRPVRGGPAAADIGRRYVERARPERPPLYPYPGDVSRFGWDHLLISALAAACRHLDPDAAMRHFGLRVTAELSRRLLPIDPCRVGPQPVDTSTVLEWDCCYFVEHCFCMAGFPLGVVESDPDPRAPLDMVLAMLGDLWDAISDHFDRDPAPDPDDDEPRTGDRRDFMRLAGSVASRLGVDAREVVDAARTGGSAEAVWPPFVSPRMLIECPALEDLGVLPRGVFSRPPAG